MTEAAFREAFHRYGGVIHRYAYRMTGSSETAEDIVQECFLAFWQKPVAYDPLRGDVRAFLLGIARNKLLMRWREERPHEPLDRAIEALRAGLVTPDPAESQEAEAVASAVEALLPLQREALILAEYEGMSLEEIAQATGAEIAAVKSRLHRARETLRQLLRPLLQPKGTLYGTRKR